MALTPCIEREVFGAAARSAAESLDSEGQVLPAAGAAACTVDGRTAPTGDRQRPLSRRQIYSLEGRNGSAAAAPPLALKGRYALRSRQST